MNSLAILNKDNITPFLRYIPQEYRFQSAGDHAVIIGVLHHDICAGAAVVSLDKGAGELVSIFVHEAMRRLGCGTLLINGAVALCKKKHLSFLTAQYPFPESDYLESFFLNRGFWGPSAGKSMIQFSLGEKELEQFKSAQKLKSGKINRLTDLPSWMFHDLRRLNPYAVSSASDLLSEASNCFCIDNNVLSFILCVPLSSGEVFIKALYCHPQHITTLGYLLGFLPAHKKVSITMANKSGYDAIDFLTKKLGLEKSVTEMHGVTLSL